MHYQTRKRVFDLALAVTLAALLAVPLVLLSIALLVLQGRPVLHASVRMRAPDRTFVLWKFRTMQPSPAGDRPLGGDNAATVTPLGRFLRPLRLDEAPQLWNILRGDMSFVGPRPPLPAVVARHPGLYAQVLRCRPGLTGLATLRFRAREERFLSRCRSAAETEQAYDRHCVRQKARFDLIYHRRQSLRLDLLILGTTMRDVVRGGAQVPAFARGHAKGPGATAARPSRPKTIPLALSSHV